MIPCKPSAAHTTPYTSPRTVQERSSTAPVPPATLLTLSTVSIFPDVIICILGGELHTVSAWPLPGSHWVTCVAKQRLLDADSVVVLWPRNIEGAVCKKVWIGYQWIHLIYWVHTLSTRLFPPAITINTAETGHYIRISDDFFLVIFYPLPPVLHLSYIFRHVIYLCLPPRPFSLLLNFPLEKN